MNIDNRPSWVPRVQAALERGRIAYKEAAEIIIAAREQDPSLTLEIVGEHLGQSKLLSWHRDGCDPRGPFSHYVPPGEQPVVSEPPSIVPPAEPPEGIPPRDSIEATAEDLGQIPLPLGSNGAAFDFVPGQGEATMDALAAIAHCVKMRQVFDRITSTANMTLVYCTSPDKRRATLERLNAGLVGLLEATTLMREQVEANLQSMPPVPMFDEEQPKREDLAQEITLVPSDSPSPQRCAD